MTLSNRRISPKELATHGWVRVVRTVGRHVFGRDYHHKDGWKITHCGHPTALWPYILEDPQGRMFLTGIRVSGRADYGTAWPTVASAVDFVASLPADWKYTGPFKGSVR